MFSEYRFVEVSNSMTFRPPQIHSLFFPASDFEKNSKFSKPNHFYVVSNRVEVKRIFRFYRNMDDEFWWATLWTPWGSGPTGGFMPNQLEKQMQQIKKNHFMTHGMNPQDNGMHSWHSSSSGKIEARCQVRQAGNVR